MTITELKRQILRTVQDATDAATPITAETHLIRDLGLSSVETMMMVTDLEDQFGIKIPTRSLRNVQTVSDLTQAVIDALR
ncbi:MAG: acyl carrier protein [Oscillospiraceae bacterium]|nr:acyl carrier protein [Oscillospiraceae bacterium]